MTNALHIIFVWVTLALYLFSFVAALFATILKNKTWAKLFAWAFRLGFLCQLAIFIWAWLFFHHFPATLRFYHAAAVLIFLLLQYILENDLVPVGIFASAITILIACIDSQPDPAVPLSATYSSQWLFAHIFFAWFAFGCFAVATAFACVYLVKAYQKNVLSSFYSLDISERLMYKLVALGLVFQAVMVAAGACWAKELIGRYWDWYPLETWSLIVFVYYSLYLHLRLLHVRGTVLAWMLLIGLVVLGISIWGLHVISHFNAPLDSLTK
jgi:ABC-type transport system involved in cytochrome c biogenesis permease subunit